MTSTGNLEDAPPPHGEEETLKETADDLAAAAIAAAEEEEDALSPRVNKRKADDPDDIEDGNAKGGLEASSAAKRARSAAKPAMMPPGIMPGFPPNPYMYPFPGMFHPPNMNAANQKKEESKSKDSNNEDATASNTGATKQEQGGSTTAGSSQQQQPQQPMPFTPMMNPMMMGYAPPFASPATAGGSTANGPPFFNPFFMHPAYMNPQFFARNMRGGTPHRPGLPIAMACDSEQLSDYQILVRQQLELFQAQQEDVESNTQGRKKPVVLDQIGLRCRHCAPFPLRARGRGAVYYPAKLHGIYQAAQNMASSHLCQACQHIPPALKQELRKLRERRDNASGGKQYWADSVKALGVYQDEQCLRLRRGEDTATAAAVGGGDEEKGAPAASASG